ncbi:MAG TPA: hypothetical protein VHS97_02040, partial [Isosphaeraceae bacterium]|nr:hypothetical protein [Isosphaeraceae bacterium]
AGDILGRLEAAKELAEKHKDDKIACEALAKAWIREKEPLARTEMVRLVAAVGEPCRAAILNAAKDAEPRVRVAALGGLAALKCDADAEAILRATWSNKAEAYGARSAALRALVSAKVNDADELIASALKDPSDPHSLAPSALQTILDRGGQKAREAAVLYSRPGQPSPLRAVAIQALSKQAKDDPQAEKLLIALVDDPVQSVRTSAMFAVTSGGFTAAVPALERQLPKINGPMRQLLKAQIENLKNGTKTDKVASDSRANEPADLERQAADLELQAKELRNRAEALKLKAERAKLATSKPTS